jgi:hypothetical protein
MGTALEYRFVDNCNSVSEAFDRAGGNAEVFEDDLYTGALKLCESPRKVGGPRTVNGKLQTVSERIEELWDTLGKTDSCGFLTDGGVMLVYAAPE